MVAKLITKIDNTITDNLDEEIIEQRTVTGVTYSRETSKIEITVTQFEDTVYHIYFQPVVT